MELYGEELKKILNKKITWILTGALLVFFLGQTVLEVGRVQDFVNDFNLAAGYKRFLDLAELILVVGIIVQIIVLTPIFCEDKELGTDKLIYSTAKGRVKDYTARVLVVLSITAGINLILMLLTGIANMCLYGMPDRAATMEQIFVFDAPLANQRINVFIVYYVFNIIIQSLFTTAIIAFFSTFCKKVINAEIIAFAVLFAPAFLESIFRNLGSLAYCFIAIQPVMAITLRIAEGTWSFNTIKILAELVLSFVLLVLGSKRWTGEINK